MKNSNENRYSRQSFLGSTSARAFERSCIAVIGAGGGGSHVIQQLAHIGVGRIQIFDPDKVEVSNLNRLVGATEGDAALGALKADVGARLVSSVHSTTMVSAFPVQWQQAADQLREADMVISCVDSYAARQDIESTARRFLIPMVDIGMDVHLVGGKPHLAGQVVLSSPLGPCMRCLGFLTDELLRLEADQYAAAGARPQVVWSNGVLASLAVGVAIAVLTGWDGISRKAEYLHYDGNSQLVTRSPRVEFAPAECSHYPLNAIGEPTFR